MGEAINDPPQNRKRQMHPHPQPTPRHARPTPEKSMCINFLGPKNFGSNSTVNLPLWKQRHSFPSTSHTSTLLSDALPLPCPLHQKHGFRKPASSFRLHPRRGAITTNARYGTFNIGKPRLPRMPYVKTANVLTRNRSVPSPIRARRRIVAFPLARAHPRGAEPMGWARFVR